MAIKFYYQDHNSGIYIIHGDCLKILPELKKEFPTGFDLQISDPPYGISYRSNHVSKDTVMGKEIANDENLDLVSLAAPLIWNNLKDNTAAYFFAHPNMIGENRNILDKYFTYKNTIVWDKGEGGTFGDLEAGYSLNWEAVLYYNKGRRKLNGKRPRCIYRWPWSSRSDPVHPNAKPRSIMSFFIRNSSNEGDIVLDPFMGCYDEHTEVLTDQGWRFFKDLNKTEKFLTRSPKGVLEYQEASSHQIYDYSGDMISILSRSTDLLVTPNHNMLVQSHTDFCKKTPAKLISADELLEQVYRIPNSGTYRSLNDELSEQMMYLIGLYVSEGYIKRHKKSIVICQKQGAKLDEMMSKVNDFNPQMYGDRKFIVDLTSAQLEFIINNCGEGAEHKFLSSKILNNKYLKSLFDAMILGDGHTTKSGQQVYYTVSKRLSDGFQELCQKLGFGSTEITRESRDSEINGRIILHENCQPQYEISVRRSLNKKILQKHILKVFYSGKVYCVTVPNHTLYVRRNGKASWCGNSGVVGAACKIMGRGYVGIELERQYCDRAVERLEQEMLFEKTVANSNPIQENLYG